jgi:hypothetical protein
MLNDFQLNDMIEDLWSRLTLKGIRCAL